MSASKGKFYRFIHSKFMIILPLGLILLSGIFFGFCQYQEYKADQLIEHLNNINRNDISSITLFTRGFHTINATKEFEGDSARNIVAMLQDQSYHYYTEPNKFSKIGYDPGEILQIDIRTSQKESMSLRLMKNAETEHVFAILYGEDIYDSSAVYKVPYDKGRNLYDWLMEQ